MSEIIEDEKIKDDLTRIVGLDVANSTIKIWTDKLNMQYLNTIRQVNDAGMVYSFRTDYQMFVVNEKIYEVGLDTAAPGGARSISRYGSEQYRTEALIALAMMINSLEDAEDKEILRVVTGVPSNLAKNQSVIEKIKESLVGTHEIKVVSWNDVMPITFEIRDVIVVPQPLGTMYDYVYNEEFDMLDERLLDQRAIVVDIGWGTTDLAVLESARVRSTFSFDIGTSDFISNLQEDVSTNLPEASIFSLAPHELDMKLLQSSTVETPFGAYDLKEYVEKHKKIQAERIYQEIMGLGLEFNKFFKIILTGGGSLLYEENLKQLFNDPRIIIQENAIMSNCKGFWLLGNY